MNILLQKLLMRGRVYMAPADDNNFGGGEDDLDDDDDLDSDPAPEAKKPEVKIGDQDDGSVIVELEDEEQDDGKGQQASKGESGTEATGEEGEDDEAAREEIRAARRKERQERKARQREKEESTRRELAAERAARKELEDRLAKLEGRDRSRDLAGVEAGLRRTESAYETAKAAYAAAIAEHDGEAATAALEQMDVARENYRQLTAAKQNFETQQRAPKTNVNPAAANYAQAFINEHKWYKHEGDDEDSAIVKTIDIAMHRQGWDPSTKEYWDELRARVKKYLPHRVASGKVLPSDGKDPVNKQTAPARQQKTVVGGGGGESAGAGKGTFMLSPERVKAIKDAGMWDDPKARNEMIRRYRDYDKTNSKGN